MTCHLREARESPGRVVEDAPVEVGIHLHGIIPEVRLGEGNVGVGLFDHDPSVELGAEGADVPRRQEDAQIHVRTRVGIPACEGPGEQEADRFGVTGDIGERLVDDSLVPSMHVGLLAVETAF